MTVDMTGLSLPGYDGGEATIGKNVALLTTPIEEGRC